MPFLGRAGRMLPEPVRRLARRSRRLFTLKDRLEGAPAGPDPLHGDLRPVVYLPTWLRWDVMRQRPQFLLQAMAEAGHEVWFVDPLEPVSHVADGVHVVRSLREVPARGVILYTHFAPTRTLFDRFVSPAVIYDILDDLSIYDPDEVEVPEERRVRHYHPTVMGQADVVIASNPVLVQRHQQETPLPILLVENGVDAVRFGMPLPRPSDLPAGPLVGFHGAIAPWIDVDLICRVAPLVPEAMFVFVGPLHGETGSAAERLSSMGNVVLLGERPSSQIASYVAAFDVGVMWFTVDTLTEGVTPLKMWEYLAAGVPVVSTPLPAAIAAERVATAAEPDQLAALIKVAVASRHLPVEIAGRKALAATADWSKRIAPLLDRLDELDIRRVR